MYIIKLFGIIHKVKYLKFFQKCCINYATSCHWGMTIESENTETNQKVHSWNVNINCTHCCNNSASFPTNDYVRCSDIRGLGYERAWTTAG